MTEKAKPWPRMSPALARRKLEEAFAACFDGSDFRTCVVCLGYDDERGEAHVAHGSAIQPVELESVAHLRFLSQSLRQIADHVDRLLLEGKLPKGMELTAYHEGEPAYRSKT